MPINFYSPRILSQRAGFNLSIIFEQLLPNFEIPKAIGRSDQNDINTINRNVLLNRQDFFAVQSTEEQRWLYLRTSAYDYFSDNTWDRTLNTSSIASGRLNFPQTLKATFQIRVLQDYFLWLPHTLNSIAVQSNRANFQFIVQNKATGFLLDIPIIRNEIIQVQESRQFFFEQDLKPYLQIPTAMSSEIYALASELQQDTRAETIEAIQNYLGSHFTYTLYPNIPVETDALFHFLFTNKRGYCTQFATAFVILSRLNGIPARYVTGYLAYLENKNNEVIITGENAHAWAEVYLDQWQWKTVETTAPLSSGRLNPQEFFDSLDSDDFLEDFPDDTQELPSEESHGVTLAHESIEPASYKNWNRRLTASLLFFGIIASLAVIAFLYFRNTKQKEQLLLRRFYKTMRTRYKKDPAIFGWDYCLDLWLKLNKRSMDDSALLKNWLFTAAYTKKSASAEDLKNIQRILSSSHKD